MNILHTTASFIRGFKFTRDLGVYSGCAQIVYPRMAKRLFNEYISSFSKDGEYQERQEVQRLAMKRLEENILKEWKNPEELEKLALVKMEMNTTTLKLWPFFKSESCIC